MTPNTTSSESVVALSNRVAAAIACLSDTPARLQDALARIDDAQELCQHLSQLEPRGMVSWEERRRLLRSTERTIRVNNDL